MNSILATARRRPLPAVLARTAAAALAATAGSLLLTGCGGEATFAKVNGQVITKDEYIHALERQTVNVPGATQPQAVNAERLVIDQLVGNKVILAEAEKNGVRPTEAQVDSVYNVQKNLFEKQSPGKQYEKALEEQGATPEEIKTQLRVDLATTALYAKRLKLDETEVRKTYDQLAQSGQLGLPERVQIRLIVVPPKGPQFTEASKMLAQKTPFAEVASKVNAAPQLRASGGLFPQAQPIAALPEPWRPKAQQTAIGGNFGPVDFQGNKAWVHIEQRQPAFKLSFEEAAPLVRKRLVEFKILQPENAQIRNDIMSLKMQAKFEATDKSYEGVWNALKESARQAGVGQQAGGMIPGGGAAPAPGAGGPGAPPPGPATVPPGAAGAGAADAAPPIKPGS